MTTTNTTIINSWGEVKQKLFYADREIVNANKRVQPNANAQKLQYTTKEGVAKLFYYADEVTVVDTSALREVEKQKRELFKLYMQHEIGLADYTAAMAELEGK